MAVKSPKHKLIRNGRGWVKRLGGRVKWIASATACPTGEDADAFFEANFGELASDRPPAEPGTQVGFVAEAFTQDRESRKLHRGTLRDYSDTMQRIVDGVGVDRDTAALGEADAAKVVDAMSSLGTQRRMKHVTIIRMFIRWCGRKGIACGWKVTDFVPPTKAERRRDRAKRKKKPYTPAQVRRLLCHASDRLRAAILLCLNCAMGPDEVLTLTRADVKSGIIDKARQKTGVERRIPLWPETIKAIEGMGRGHLFAKPGGGVLNATTLMHKFRSLCKRSCVPMNGLYTLRRTFRTIADDWGDHRAAALVMGRELPDIDTVYVLEIKDDRIVRMLDHVKTTLRIGSALAAKRVTQGQHGLAARLARRAARRAADPSVPSAPPANTAKSRPASKRGSSRRP